MSPQQIAATIRIMNDYTILSIDEPNFSICAEVGYIICYLDIDRNKRIEITEDGRQYWFEDDGFHRLDGPAIEYPRGGKSWCINNVFLSQEEHAAAVLKLKQGETE